MTIKSIEANEIIASNGYPTIEVRVRLDNGHIGIASVPYGESAGLHEATELFDNDKSRWNGRGMLLAISNIKSELFSSIKDIDAEDQNLIDDTMCRIDGTENKSRLGGNAILAVSLATAKAVSIAKGIPLYKYIIETYKTNPDLSQLPKPMVVVIEGGKHASNTTDLQEFCITAIANASVKENIRKAIETYHELKAILLKSNLSINVGNEGAFAPNGILSNELPFKFILEAIRAAGYIPGEDLAISIDAAASEFFIEGKYYLKIENKTLSAEDLIDYYENWFKKYPIITVEDMFAEDDWESWIKFKRVTDKYHIELLGDDLTVTNIKRLQMALDRNSISAAIVKLNQIGTLSETVRFCMLANKSGLMTTTSHRGGGETIDTSMIDVAIAVGSRYIKVGPSRGERVVKFNRLMEIERELNNFLK